MSQTFGADRNESAVTHYARIVRHNLALVLVLTLGVPLVAVLVSLTQEDRYAATSTVLVSRQSVANQLSGGTDVGLQQQSFQQILVTQARLARTPTVLRKTLSAISLPVTDGTVKQLEADTTVEAEQDSDLLNFTVTRGTPDQARRLAVAYANSYIAYRRDLDGAALEKALEDVDAALVAERAATRPSSARIERLSASRQDLEQRLVLQTANAQVVAVPSEAPQVQPRPARNGLVGLILGALLGIGAALLRNAVDTRVRSGSEAEAVLDTPVLSRLPRPRGRNRKGDSAALVMRSAPGGPEAEGFRILRANLNFGLVAHAAKTVMVTSAVQGEGKSTTVANLAVATAMSGKRVAIVDLDLRRPTLARLFEINSGVGITTTVVEGATLDEALVEVDLPGLSEGAALPRTRGSLHVLPSGSLPPDPAEFVGSNAVVEVVRELRERFDIVYIDAPPVLAVSDATIIASYADAAFICVRIGVVRRAMLRETHRALDRLDVAVLGQVVTGAETDAEGRYGDYYTYSASTSQQGETVSAPSAP
jgi:capsular exopolysaccharide synthesis family protein